MLIINSIYLFVNMKLSIVMIYLLNTFSFLVLFYLNPFQLKLALYPI